MDSADLSTVLADLAAWSERSDRRAGIDLAEAGLVLRLLADELGVHDPGRLREGHLDALVLDVYPAYLDRADEAEGPGSEPSDFVEATAALLDFARDTERLDAATVAALGDELDEVGEALLSAFDGLDGDEDDIDAADIDLKQAYGLPDRLGPIRLPSHAELAAMARGCAMLDRARRLAEHLASGSGYEPGTIAAALGVDQTELPTLSALAVELEFLDLPHVADPGATDETGTADEAGGDDDAALTGTAPTAGSGLNEWPGGTDQAVLDTWRSAFNAVLAWSLLTDAEQAGETELDFTGGGSWFVPLFLARHGGMPASVLGAMIEELAVDGLSDERARQAWGSWVAAHGDPGSVLLGRLVELGAVEVDGETVWASPLAAWSVREELLESDVDIPLLPAAEEMTAHDVVAIARDGLDGELETEAPHWFVTHGDAAAGKVLEVAAGGGPIERMIATQLVREHAGETAEAHWRAVVDDPWLHRHAKLELSTLHGDDSEFALSDDDLGWLLVDSIAAVTTGAPEDELPALLESTAPPESRTMIDELWRADHPATAEVLTLLGERHPDKTIAKAARKGTFRAADRTGS